MGLVMAVIVNAVVRALFAMSLVMTDIVNVVVRARFRHEYCNG